ncbi:hypothetical protein NMG60_11033803 [Bertholletia excelsa]
MIYRKWSLLTMPGVVLGSIVAVVAIGSYIFVKNDPFLKPDPRKQDKVPSSK